MDKLIIDRKRWARGKPADGRGVNYLLSHDGSLCCLGFCMAQMGVPAEALLAEGCPNEVVSNHPGQFYRVRDVLVHKHDRDDAQYAGQEFTDSLTADSAIDANDDDSVTDEVREQEVSDIFKRHGIAVTFVDTPEETEALCGMPVDFGVRP